uniref:Uncharacterized protein n=1 Tax=Anguilla anguilla TaxID=7936 RepID=A0A0E9TF18_ANGAN
MKSSSLLYENYFSHHRSYIIIGGLFGLFCHKLLQHFILST